MILFLNRLEIYGHSQDNIIKNKVLGKIDGMVLNKELKRENKDSWV